MSKRLFGVGVFIPHGLHSVTNRTGKPDRILTNAEWMRIWHAGRPREELIWRLNQRLKGNDPGRPNEWKGIR